MYKLLKDSLKIRRYLLVTILVIQFISVILSTLLPYMNGMFVDMLIDIKNVEEVIKYAITIAGVGIISLFLSYIYNLKIMKVKNNISFEINTKLNSEDDISIVAHRIRTILGFNVKKYISFRFNINSAVCMAADTRSACHI